MTLLPVPTWIRENPDPDPPTEPWLSFVPNSEAQARTFWTWTPRVGYSGRLGSSKSRTCCQGAYFDATFWPRNRVLLTRKRATDLFATTFTTMRDEVVPPQIWNEKRKPWGYRPTAQGGPTLFLPNGSRIIFLGLDEPMKIRSGAYGSIYVDQAEDLEDEERKTAESRLRHRVSAVKLTRAQAASFGFETDQEHVDVPLRRRIVYAFNPSHDYHWGNIEFKFRELQEAGASRHVIRTKEDVKLLGGTVVKAGRPMKEAVLASPADNAANLPPDYQLLLSQYVGPWRDRFVLGKWGTFEGQVLPNFDPALHVVDPPAEWARWDFKPPPTWTRYCGVDFGFGPGHAFVFQWFAVRPSEETPWGYRPEKWHLYREIYMTGEGHRMLHGVPGIVSEHAKRVLALEQSEVTALGEAIRAWNAEHPRDALEEWEYFAAELRAADPASPGGIADLGMSGIACWPAENDRLPGAQIVAEFLEPFEDPVPGPNGEKRRDARLVFLRNALVEEDPVLKEAGDPFCTWQEMGGIMWRPPPASGQGAAKEDWVAKRDHGFAGLRYALLTVRKCGSVGVVHIPSR